MNQSNTVVGLFRFILPPSSFIFSDRLRTVKSGLIGAFGASDRIVTVLEVVKLALWTSGNEWDFATQVLLEAGNAVEF